LSGYFGRGEGIGHAGELLQGALRLNGRVEPFLVTLPAPEYRSEAAARSARRWSVNPRWKTKALGAAQAACARWDVRGAMALTIASAIPVGRGCGSSTADCVAAVRAVAAAVGVFANAEEIAEIVHCAEVACDPTMFGREPVVFLPRAGRVLRRLAPRWPALRATVADLGGPAVDTDACSVPRYTADELEEFRELLARLESAFDTGDGRELARVAMRSAHIHQRRRPHSRWLAFRDSAMRQGAWGVAISHSGTVAAVLAAPEAEATEEVGDVHLAGRRR